jgi:hypothetical protein
VFHYSDYQRFRKKISKKNRFYFLTYSFYLFLLPLKKTHQSPQPKWIVWVQAVKVAIDVIATLFYLFVAVERYI